MLEDHHVQFVLAVQHQRISSLNKGKVHQLIVVWELDPMGEGHRGVLYDVHMGLVVDGKNPGKTVEGEEFDLVIDDP